MDTNGNVVLVFDPSKKHISYEISVEYPTAIALDSSGALYIATRSGAKFGSIEVYAPGTSTLTRTVSNGIYMPVAMTFDQTGDLFVANGTHNGDTVTVYPPGGSIAVATITDEVQDAYVLATDSTGNLYVGKLPRTGSGSVNVYAAGTFSLADTISGGVNRPTSLALDAAQNLYVGNATNVTIYAPGTTIPLRTIPTEAKGYETAALCFDSSGVLYAAYGGKDYGGVKLFAPGSNTPMLSIGHRHGVAQPIAMAIGP